MKTFRVAPDGVLLDHAAEFAYMSNKRIRTLFECDTPGYLDAVAKLVQTLATSEKILVTTRPSKTEATETLRAGLEQAGCLEYSEFFDDETKEMRLSASRNWLSENWTSICSELNNPESRAEAAMIGHLQREFYYFWCRWDSRWDAHWYSPEQEVLDAPEGVVNRLLRPVTELARRHDVQADEETLKKWVNRNLTTHFRIFAEYWLHLGRKTGDEYMPALTRSSLGFIRHQPRHSEIESVVMPFVGLAALKKVKHRHDMIERVIEWNQTEGKEIIEGLQHLQSIVRNTKSEDEKKKLISEVQDILNSKLSRGFRITVNLVKLFASTAKLGTDVKAAETVVDLSFSKSYRWLWQIRDPELHWKWKRKLKKLLVS